MRFGLANVLLSSVASSQSSKGHPGRNRVGPEMCNTDRPLCQWAVQPVELAEHSCGESWAHSRPCSGHDIQRIDPSQSARISGNLCSPSGCVSGNQPRPCSKTPTETKRVSSDLFLLLQCLGWIRGGPAECGSRPTASRLASG